MGTQDRGAVAEPDVADGVGSDVARRVGAAPAVAAAVTTWSAGRAH